LTEFCSQAVQGLALLDAVREQVSEKLWQEW